MHYWVVIIFTTFVYQLVVSLTFLSTPPHCSSSPLISSSIHSLIHIIFFRPPHYHSFCLRFILCLLLITFQYRLIHINQLRKRSPNGRSRKLVQTAAKRRETKRTPRNCSENSSAGQRDSRCWREHRSLCHFDRFYPSPINFRFDWKTLRYYWVGEYGEQSPSLPPTFVHHTELWTES